MKDNTRCTQDNLRYKKMHAEWYAKLHIKEAEANRANLRNESIHSYDYSPLPARQKYPPQSQKAC